MAQLAILIINILGLCGVLGVKPVCITTLACTVVMIICQVVVKVIDKLDEY